jgi:hypothetical protein
MPAMRAANAKRKAGAISPFPTGANKAPQPRAKRPASDLPASDLPASDRPASDLPAHTWRVAFALTTQEGAMQTPVNAEVSAATAKRAAKQARAYLRTLKLGGILGAVVATVREDGPQAAFAALAA